MSILLSSNFLHSPCHSSLNSMTRCALPAVAAIPHSTATHPSSAQTQGKCSHQCYLFDHAQFHKWLGNLIAMQMEYYNFCGNFIYNANICINCGACMCHQFERGSSGYIAYDLLKFGTAFHYDLCHHHRQGNSAQQSSTVTLKTISNT